MTTPPRVGMALANEIGRRAVDRYWHLSNLTDRLHGRYYYVLYRPEDGDVTLGPKRK